MIILHYVNAIKIKLSLAIIVTWHFVPFSRDRTENWGLFPGIL